MLKRWCILICAFAVALVGRGEQLPIEAYPSDSITSWNKNIKDVNWQRVAVTLGIRIGLKIAIVDVLKNNVHEWRPDDSDNHSFPSRHATWAFGIGGKIAYSLGPYSPWWAVSAQAVADAVGMQRVITRRHYPHDVLAGAALGVGTDLLAKVIGNWIYGREDNFPQWRYCHNINAPAIDVSTAAIFPLINKWGDYRLEMGLASSVRSFLPTSEVCGAYAQCEISSLTIKEGSKCLHPLTSVAVTAGLNCHKALNDGPFALAGRIGGGYRFNLRNKSIEVNSGNLQVQGAVECSVNVTRNLAFAIDGYCQLDRLQLGAERKTMPSLGVSFLTRANF